MHAYRRIATLVLHGTFNLVSAVGCLSHRIACSSPVLLKRTSMSDREFHSSDESNNDGRKLSTHVSNDSVEAASKITETTQLLLGETIKDSEARVRSTPYLLIIEANGVWFRDI